MQQFCNKSHSEWSSDMAKPGRLIKQHYQGEALFQVVKSSLLIPIPGCAHFWIYVCVWERESDKWLFCIIGHKTVLVCSAPFHGKPVGHVRKERIRRVTWPHVSLAHDNVNWTCKNEWLGQGWKPWSRTNWWLQWDVWILDGHKNTLRWLTSSFDSRLMNRES